MSRLATMLAALADTALAVVVGIVAPIAVGTAGWLISGGFQTTQWEVPLAAAMAIWTLGLTSSVGFTITPAAYPALQLAEPFAFVVSLAPLAVSAYVIWFAWRTGRRIVDADEDAPWLALAVSAVAFIVANQLALTLGGTHLARLEPGGVAAGGTLLWVVGLLAGAKAWEYVPWTRLLGDRTDTIMLAAGRAVRLGLGLVVGMFALASALVLVGLALNMGSIVGLTQLLQLDAWGNIAVGLTELLYVPTLLVWAISWLLGAGVQLGAGAVATPGATDAGPLPILPLLGIIPEPQGAMLWALLALPVLLAALCTVWLRSTTRDAEAGVWWQRLIVPAAGSAVAALVLAWLALLSRGAVGPGRLTEFGPVPWLVLLWALGLFLVGSAAGAFVPVTARAGAEDDDESFRDFATEDLDDVRAARPLRAVEDDDYGLPEYDLDAPARDPWWRRVADWGEDRYSDLTARRHSRAAERLAKGSDAAESGDDDADALTWESREAGGRRDSGSDARDDEQRGADMHGADISRAEHHAADVRGYEADADETPGGELPDDAAFEEAEDEDAPLRVVRRPAAPPAATADDAEPDEADTIDLTDIADAADARDDERSLLDENGDDDRDGRASARAKRKKPAPRRDLGNLADALHRPDEPDIYGDLDLDLDGDARPLT
jgi:hypothetical protein